VSTICLTIQTPRLIFKQQQRMLARMVWYFQQPYSAHDIQKLHSPKQENMVIINNTSYQGNFTIATTHASPTATTDWGYTNVTQVYDVVCMEPILEVVRCRGSTHQVVLINKHAHNLVRETRKGLPSQYFPSFQYHPLRPCI
jgi:hypothetical protein